MDGTRLDSLRLLLLGDATDDSQDKLIELIYGYSVARLRLTVGTIYTRYGLTLPSSPEVPTGLEWMVDEVVARRFNRIGSEGMSSESVGGHSVSFSDLSYDEYLDDLDKYVGSLEGADLGAMKGRVYFY